MDGFENFQRKPINITVLGIGYVGLVIAACFAEVGNKVVCFDVNQQKITDLNNHKFPIYEPSLKNLVLRNCKRKRLKFVVDYKYVLQRVN